MFAHFNMPVSQISDRGVIRGETRFGFTGQPYERIRGVIQYLIQYCVICITRTAGDDLSLMMWLRGMKTAKTVIKV